MVIILCALPGAFGAPDKEKKDPGLAPRPEPGVDFALVETCSPGSRPPTFDSTRAPRVLDLGVTKESLFSSHSSPFDAPESFPRIPAQSYFTPIVAGPRGVFAGVTCALPLDALAASTSLAPPTSSRETLASDLFDAFRAFFRRHSSNSARLSRAPAKDLNDIRLVVPARFPHADASIDRRDATDKECACARARAAASRDAVAPSARVATTTASSSQTVETRRLRVLGSVCPSLCTEVFIKTMCLVFMLT
jgi:hypothetical protein